MNTAGSDQKGCALKGAAGPDVWVVSWQELSVASFNNLPLPVWLFSFYSSLIQKFRRCLMSTNGDRLAKGHQAPSLPLTYSWSFPELSISCSKSAHHHSRNSGFSCILRSRLNPMHRLTVSFAVCPFPSVAWRLCDVRGAVSSWWILPRQRSLW